MSTGQNPLRPPNGLKMGYLVEVNEAWMHITTASAFSSLVSVGKERGRQRMDHGSLFNLRVSTWEGVGYRGLGTLSLTLLCPLTTPRSQGLAGEKKAGMMHE